MAAKATIPTTTMARMAPVAKAGGRPVALSLIASPPRRRRPRSRRGPRRRPRRRRAGRRRTYAPPPARAARKPPAPRRGAPPARRCRGWSGPASPPRAGGGGGGGWGGGAGGERLQPGDVAAGQGRLHRPGPVGGEVVDGAVEQQVDRLLEAAGGGQAVGVVQQGAGLLRLGPPVGDGHGGLPPEPPV